MPGFMDAIGGMLQRIADPAAKAGAGIKFDPVQVRNSREYKTYVQLAIADGQQPMNEEEFYNFRMKSLADAAMNQNMQRGQQQGMAR